MDIRVKDPYDDYVSGTPRVILDSNPGGAPPPIQPGDAVVASQVVYNSDGTVSIGIDGNLRTQNNLENFRKFDEQYGNGSNRFEPDDLYEGGNPNQLPTGGNGSPINIIRGCMDPNSLNYNPLATVDDGSCSYEVPERTAKNKTITLTLNANKRIGQILVNGKNFTKTEKNSISFSATEVLSPTTISVNNTSGKSKEEYTLIAFRQTVTQEIKPIRDLLPESDVILEEASFQNIGVSITGDAIKSYGDYLTPEIRNIGSTPLALSGFGNQAIPNIYLGYSQPVYQTSIAPRPELILGNISFDYYTFVIEKKSSSNGITKSLFARPYDSELDTKGLGVTIQGNDRESAFASATLQFTLEDTNPPPLPIPYVTDVECDLAGEGIIQYFTSWGESGNLPSSGKLTISVDNPKVPPTIKFVGVGISDYTHDVKYEYYSDSLSKAPKYSINSVDADFKKIDLYQTIKVRASRVEFPPDPQKPNIRVDFDSVTYNIGGGGNLKQLETLKIPYTTSYSDHVIFQLGNNKKKIARSGSLILTPSDFLNGVGQYTIYLQPISERGGSGDYKKVVVNVISKNYIPGPDITHVKYPQNIKGADFKEYDVPFKISWQSINTNYINVFVGKRTTQTFLGQFSKAGAATFNVEDVLRKAGDRLDANANIISFDLLLIPFNAEGDELTEGKEERITITFDKADLKLRRGKVIADLRKAFLSNIDTNKLTENSSKLLTHYLHLGDGNNKLISTWAIDNATFAEEYTDETTNETKYRNVEKSLVLKLYEPLPRNIGTNDTLWVSKIQSVPLIDDIEITEDFSNLCTPLTPNFNLNVTDSIGYQILDDLVASGSNTSAEVINEFVSSSNFSLSNLDIDFVKQKEKVFEEYSGSGDLVLPFGLKEYNWEDFVKYSSAEERSANFFYKVELLEIYQNKIDEIDTKESTVSLTNQKTKLEKQINDVKKGFDAFEKFLYTSSSIDTSVDGYALAYPKTNGTGSLLSTGSIEAQGWYSHIISSSRYYDNNNTSRLSYNLPEYIKLDDKNDEFILFFDMIGQHFDTLYTHIKGISRSKKLEHKFDKGINSDLVYHLLESFGFNADTGAESQLLWEYAFGYWDKNKNLREDGSQKSTLSAKDRQQEIWRRLLNNLPYLNKHKGTKRALHAAMSCYGVPASLLTIMEFGGPKDPSQSGTTKYTFEDRTAAINLNNSAAITVPWKQFSNDLSTDYPNAVEFRINTQDRQDQRLLQTDGWSLHLLKDTGSLAKFELRVSGSGTIYSASTDTGSFFNDEYTHVVVSKEVSDGDDVFTIYAKEGFQERIRTNVSGSLTISGVSSWKSGSELTLGGDAGTATSSIDEFRLWRTPLSESRVDNHTLFPDAIDGNHISASTHDLIFRNDFEYPKNRHSGGDTAIKNVALTTSYTTYSTASNFSSVTDYPYQYTPYDRDVTANVPSTGFNFANKVRFESQTKLIDLSYRQRATKKSFDQSPVDSNRLGLFFSPIKEINLDILKGLGEFNIDNYIGNPGDEYSDEYSDLKTLRNYYFSRYTLNLHEYIQLVRYIDKSLFKTLESLVPARAQVAKGLLIEPHILERSKTKWTKPSGLYPTYTSSIDVEQDVNVTSDNPQYNMIISASQDVNLVGTNPQYIGTVDAESDVIITSTKDNYEGTIQTEDTTTLEGTITRNSGSDMGGISFTVNAQITGSVTGQYDSTQYQQIGMDPESLTVAGFGLYGSGSYSIRTRLVNNTITKDRVKVFLLKQSYTEDVPQNINSNDPSLGVEFVTQTKYKQVVNILPFTGSNGLESSDPIVGGNISQVTPLDGHFPLHYRNVGDLTTGLENSYFNGSKQTQATTLDGGSPVQTFTTNPNTLRVSDSSRGSGEPILEVD